MWYNSIDIALVQFFRESLQIAPFLIRYRTWSISRTLESALSFNAKRDYNVGTGGITTHVVSCVTETYKFTQ